MKVLMFGRGVIATLYGWALQQAGHDVHFYVRPGRAAAYGETVDLDLLDARRRPWGKRVVRSWPVHYCENPEPSDDFELIVLSVPHHRLPDAATFLAPRIGNATVLMFGNVWAEPQAAVGPLPLDQVAWGFPQAGGAFDREGVLRGAMLASVLFGSFGQTPTARELAVRRVFRQAGFRLREQPDFRGWLWLHFISDAGMSAHGLRRGSMAELVGARADLREAILTSRELLPLLQARGLDLRRHRSTTLALRAPSWVTASVLALALRHLALARTSLEAHSDPDAEEPRAVCRDALAEARRLRVAAPRLEALEPIFAIAEPAR